MAKIVSQSLVITVQKLVSDKTELDHCHIITDTVEAELQETIDRMLPNYVVEIVEISDSEFIS